MTTVVSFVVDPRDLAMKIASRQYLGGLNVRQLVTEPIVVRVDPFDADRRKLRLLQLARQRALLWNGLGRR